jgi:hypothetical protein
MAPLIRDITKSAANTPITMESSSDTQLPIAQEVKAILAMITAPTPANKTLPMELWMCILEHVNATEDFARSEFVKNYATSLTTHGDSKKATKTLPPFETQTWKQSRVYYTINRASRAAALQLQLSLRVLQSCSLPVQPFDCQMQFQKLRDSDGSDPRTQHLPPLQKHLGYVAIQLYEKEYGPSSENTSTCAMELLVKMYVVARFVSLTTAGRVVLLMHPKEYAAKEMYWPERIRDRITKFWQRYDLEGGEVEIMC